MQESLTEGTSKEKETKETIARNGQKTRVIKAVSKMPILHLLILAICFIVYIVASSYVELSKEDVAKIENTVENKIDEKFSDNGKKFDALLTAVKGNTEAIKEINESINRLHPLSENPDGD